MGMEHIDYVVMNSQKWVVFTHGIRTWGKDLSPSDKDVTKYRAQL